MKPNKMLSILIVLCLLTMGMSGLYGFKIGCALMKDVNYIKESAYKTNTTQSALK